MTPLELGVSRLKAKVTVTLKLNNLSITWEQIYLGSSNLVMTIDDPFGILRFHGKGQGHSGIVAENLVWSITWEHTDLGLVVGHD